MPKPRKSAGTLFSISPWQDRSEKGEDAEQPGEVDYTVVHEDLVKVDHSAKQPPTADSGEQHSLVIKIPAATIPAIGGGWRTKVVKQVEDTPMIDASQDFSTDKVLPPEDYTDRVVKSQATAVAAPSSLAPPRSSTLVSLTGTAFLVLLGGSRIVGNFTLLDQPSVSYPLHGKELTSYRECTRDPEWSIIKLHLLNLPHRNLPRELVIVAERTGGDAMKLRSPVEWQGDEVEAFAEELKKKSDDGFGVETSQNGLELEFECHNLLNDASADEQLAKVMPGAVGMGAMINTGPMKLTWREEI
jgi:hypothetical protein